MRITFYIPAPLRQHTGGLNKLEIDGSGSTVGEALASLWHAYPGLRDRILTEQGEVRQHVNIFVGEESIRYCGGFAADERNVDHANTCCQWRCHFMFGHNGRHQRYSRNIERSRRIRDKDGLAMDFALFFGRFAKRGTTAAFYLNPAYDVGWNIFDKDVSGSRPT